MEELQKQLKDLVVAHLFAGIRDGNGHLDREKQSRIFLKMVAIQKTEDLFSYRGEEFSSRQNDQRKNLKDLVKALPPKQKESLNDTKNEILNAALEEIIEKMGAEDTAKELAMLEAEHAKKIIHLASQIEYGKSRDNVTWIDKLQTKINLPYAFLLISIVLFLAALTVKGLVSDPEVSIVFNIGEIIGGLLVGAGAAVAGIAYAIKENDNSDREHR